MTTGSLTQEQQKLITDHFEYAKNVSLQLARERNISMTVLDEDDVVQLGHQGLVQAARRFNFEAYDKKKASLTNNFKSFAYRRIRGNILDECRRLSFVKRQGIDKGVSFTFVPYGIERNSELNELPDIEIDLDDRSDFYLGLSALEQTERDVIMRAAEGYTNKEIGRDLGISSMRVGELRKSATQKLAEFVNLPSS